MSRPKCQHPEKDTVIVFIKTPVDHRPMPRYKCQKCGQIGSVIYKVSPKRRLEGKPVDEQNLIMQRMMEEIRQ